MAEPQTCGKQQRCNDRHVLLPQGKGCAVNFFNEAEKLGDYLKKRKFMVY